MRSRAGSVLPRHLPVGHRLILGHLLATRAAANPFRGRRSAAEVFCTGRFEHEAKSEAVEVEVHLSGGRVVQGTLAQRGSAARNGGQ